jgi:hypothetical protein
MKAFLLGLERDFRGEETVSECNRLGLDLQVCFGLDARQESPERIAELYSEAGAKFAIDRRLSPPEVACVWGHQRMRERFLTETDQEWGLFLEDDATFVVSRFPDYADLEPLPAAPIVITLLGIPPEGMVTERIALSDGRSLAHLLDPPDYAVAYLANRAAAEMSLMSYRGRGIDSVPDWPYRWNRSVQFWAVDPPIAGIRAMESLLESQRLELQRAATRRISPPIQHLLLTLCGMRLIRGWWLGYSPRLVWQQDVVAFYRRRRWRNRGPREIAEVPSGES